MVRVSYPSSAKPSQKQDQQFPDVCHRAIDKESASPHHGAQGLRLSKRVGGKLIKDIITEGLIYILIIKLNPDMFELPQAEGQ